MTQDDKMECFSHKVTSQFSLKKSVIWIVTVKEYSIYSINRSSILPPNADEIFEKSFRAYLWRTFGEFEADVLFG